MISQFKHEKSIQRCLPQFCIAVIICASAAIFPFNAQAQSNDDCLTCHDDKELKSESGKPLYVGTDVFRNSVHGKNSVDCVMCHTDLAGVEDYPHKTGLKKVDCASCHVDQQAKYILGVHGKARAANSPDAPSCTQCHGEHDILPKNFPDSRINPINVPNICDKCHADAELAKRNKLPTPSFIDGYKSGVHGQALNKTGLVGAATCISCHDSHIILPAANPESNVNRKNIPRTCGACHVGIYQKYIMSVHGLDYLKGIQDVPVCTDCHSEHNILSPSDPDSKVSGSNMGETCSKCHDNAELERKFNLPPDRLRTYQGSYHGIASRGGDIKVANCSSCHGVHDILPSSNPLSMINPKNLPATCGKPECHGNRLENVVKGKVHLTESRQDNLWVYIISSVYKVFIILVVGGFIMFIGVDLFARMRRSRHKKAH